MPFARTKFEERRWFFGMLRAPRRDLTDKQFTRFPAQQHTAG